MKRLLNRLFVEEQGQDVIEYALLAAGISVMVIPVAPQIGTALVGVYNGIRDAVQTI
jgi:Flp pilus assembly pilin Flp